MRLLAWNEAGGRRRRDPGGARRPRAAGRLPGEPRWLLPRTRPPGGLWPCRPVAPSRPAHALFSPLFTRSLTLAQSQPCLKRVFHQPGSNCSRPAPHASATFLSGPVFPRATPSTAQAAPPPPPSVGPTPATPCGQQAQREVAFYLRVRGHTAHPRAAFSVAPARQWRRPHAPRRPCSPTAGPCAVLGSGPPEDLGSLTANIPRPQPDRKHLVKAANSSSSTHGRAQRPRSLLSSRLRLCCSRTSLGKGPLRVS